MITISDLRVTGAPHFQLRDSTGVIKAEFTVPNMVVTSGKTFLASRATSATVPVMSHMAVGSDSTAATAADTTLGNELGRAVLVSSTSDANTMTYVAFFGAGVGTGALTEAAIFNSDTGGVMLCRTTYAAINKGDSDTLTVTWNVTIN